MCNTKCPYEVQLQDNKFPPLTDKQMSAGYVIFDESAFSHWRGLLDQWIVNILKFCCETDGKVNPYKEAEICNVGLLEAAAWMSGGIAMSEHRIQFNDKTWGRLDLWMKLPEYKKIELIEAKHTTNLKLIKKNNDKDKYDYDYLKNCLKDRASKIDAKDNERVVVLLFLTFNAMDKRLFKEKINMSPADKIKYILNIVMGVEQYEEDCIENDWQLTAWCFPDNLRDDHHPGIIMSAKSI